MNLFLVLGALVALASATNIHDPAVNTTRFTEIGLGNNNGFYPDGRKLICCNNTTKLQLESRANFFTQKCVIKHSKICLIYGFIFILYNPQITSIKATMVGTITWLIPTGAELTCPWRGRRQ